MPRTDAPSTRCNDPALLELLVTVAVAANAATSLEEAAQTAIDAVCELIGWPVGHLYLVGPDSADLLLPTKVWHLAEPGQCAEFKTVTEAMAFPSGIGLPGRVLASGEPAWIADVASDNSCPRAKQAADIGIRSGFAFPITSGSQVLGVLECFAPIAVAPDVTLLWVLAQVGSQLGRVSERIRAEQALKASEGRFRALTQSAVDAIVSADHRGSITFWNQAAEDMFGYTSVEVMGRPLSLLMPERYREAHLHGIQRVTSGGPPAVIGRTVELSGLRKNGEEFPLELSLSTWTAGANVFFAGIIRDISERKRVQEALRESEEALRQASELESLGRLAGGIAHDFNNMLTIMLGYIGNVIDLSRPGSALRANAEEVASAAHRAAEVARQLLAFGRKQPVQPRVVPINLIVAEAQTLITRALGEDIELVMDLHDRAGLIRVDPSRFVQTVLNLAMNARDAMAEGGRLTISTRVMRLGSSLARAQRVRSGQYAVLAMADTGVGMDEQTRRRLFEPFFTTKELGKGTGLGLSVVYGIVKQSSGFIEVQSEPGQGTTFEVYLPSVRDDGDSLEALSVRPPSATHDCPARE